MPPKAKVSKGTLGRAIIRKRFQGRDPDDYTATLHSTELPDGPSWTRLQSITQQGDLEEFLHTAELAGTEFTAERMNIKIITPDQGTNPFLLTAEEEEHTIKKHKLNQEKLKIPRRPSWDPSMSAVDLHKAERDAFINWRRELAKLQEDEGLLLTPFERNLEVWRQLWRVLERSHLVVQIVDARNPLLFRCIDLEAYVKEIDLQKGNVLLINKADMLTENQRKQWADYFEENSISYVFFSAKISAEKLRLEAERRDDQHESGVTSPKDKLTERFESSAKIDDDSAGGQSGSPSHHNSPQDTDGRDDAEQGPATGEDSTIGQESDERTKVLTSEELLALLAQRCPTGLADEHTQFKKVIGLVGYPNVGKSSTINALVGTKKVSVGAMPGKTKHFQTIHISDDIVLCDCPGLVFPTFATTKADMVCNGVLPIDQLREYTGPAALVAKRIPKWVLEATYGIKIHTKPAEEGGIGVPTAEELLVSYAAARGLVKSGQGNPDEARAARYILKDYVNGKLLYNHPPPNVDGQKFNEEIYTPAELAKHTRNLIEAADGSFQVKHAASDRKDVQRAIQSSGSINTERLDSQFFGTDKSSLVPKLRGKAGVKGQIYTPVQGRVDNQGQIINEFNNVNAAIAAAHMQMQQGDKKHKKGKKNRKARSGSAF